MQTSTFKPTFSSWLKALVLCILLLSCVAPASAATVNCVANGAWNNPAIWSPSTVPSIVDDVGITGFAVTIPNGYSASAATLHLGNNTNVNSSVTNSGTGSLQISGAVSFAAGLLVSNAVLDLQGNDSVGSITGSGTFKNGKFGSDNTSTIFDGIVTSASKQGLGTVVLIRTGSVTTKLTILNGIIQVGGNNVFDATTAGGVVLSGGTLDLDSHNESLRTLEGTSGDVLLGVGILLVNTQAGDNVTYRGTISGQGSFAKDGLGTLTVGGVSYYAGTTGVLGGTLKIGVRGLPDGSALFIAAGATLADDPTSFTTGFEVKDIGALSGSGTVAINGLLRVGSDNSSSTFSGAIANLEKTGSGVLTLSGAANTVGTGGRPISIRDGVLQLGASGVLKSDATVDIFNGAVLDLNNSNQTLSVLRGQGSIFYGNGTANTLTLSGSSSSFFYGTINGADTTDAFVMNSTGVVTLGGDNAFRGAVTVSAGVLINNGSLPTQNTVTVGSAGTLGGSGSAGTLQIAGKVNPGPAVGQPGRFFCDSATFSATGALSIDIPNQSDQLTVSGDVTINAASTLLLDLNGYVAPGGESQIFTVLDCFGTLSGTFGTVTVSNNTSGKTIILTYTSRSVLVSVGDIAPTVDLNGQAPGTDFNINYTEGNQPIPVSDTGMAMIADPDSTTLTSLTVTLTNLQDGTSEVLAADTSNTALTAVYTPATGVLLISGVADLNQYQSVLRRLTYVNNSNNPGTVARLITFVANDGLAAGFAATTTVNVFGINNPPSVDLNGSATGTAYAGTFTEGGSPAPAVNNTALVVKEDGPTLASVTITLTNVLDTGKETLSANVTGTDITAAYATNVLTLSGADTVANYQQVLRTVVYNNTSKNPNTTARVITFVLNDGAQNGPISTATITVLSVDNVPSFVKGANQTVAEDSGLQTVTNWATAISPGPAEESTQKVGFMVSNDNSGLFSVQPSISDTGTLTYTPGQDKNGTAIVSVSLKDDGTTANGGVDTSPIQTFTITLTPVSDVFVVKNTSDSGAGSLRDCMQRAGFGDTITFDADVFDLTNSDAATLISVSSPLPTLSSGNVIIDASDRRVTLNGSAAGSSYGLDITSAGNTVRGLSIIRFTSSGVALRSGAKNNIIGGSRLVGTGPNGQGLRIASCGAFGVEINGIGTDSNAVKGCWLGLDKSGEITQSNLAGILIQGGAKNNIIGSADGAEANVISGNAFEGITVSGAGTDDNIILGNFVGTKASANTATTPAASSYSRSFAVSSRDVEGDANSAGNGSAGAFLSRGTQRTVLGGSNAGEGNAVGFNGGNGVEVRASTSIRNSVRRNRIGSNKSGGIKLYNGSNGGISKPTISSVALLTSASAAAARSSSSAAAEEGGFSRVSGTATSGGTVEVFNDSDGQGAVYISKVEVINGVWTLDAVLSTSKNVTATYTDSNGNTSEFDVHAGPGGSGGSTLFGTDADADGIADALELLAGTDPANKNDVPLDGGVLNTTKISANFNFTSSGAGKDTLSLGATFTSLSSFTLQGATAALAIGGYTSSVTLDSKGNSPTKAASVVKLKIVKTLATLTFSAKGSLASQLASTVFTDSTVTNTVITLPVAVVLSSGTAHEVWQGTVKVSYSATKGKRGILKLSK